MGWELSCSAEGLENARANIHFRSNQWLAECVAENRILRECEDWRHHYTSTEVWEQVEAQAKLLLADAGLSGWRRNMAEEIFEFAVVALRETTNGGFDLYCSRTHSYSVGFVLEEGAEAFFDAFY